MLVEIYPTNFEEKIGFDKVRELICTHCLCELGRQEVAGMSFITNFEIVRHHLMLTNEFRSILLMESNFPLGYFADLTPSLKKIRIIGTFLEVPELVDLRKSLDSIHSLLAFFKSREDNQYPCLKGLTRDIKTYPIILNRIDAILTRNASIKDNASSELLSIRRQISDKTASVGRIMQKVLKQAQNEGMIDSDSGLSFREGRAVIPVNAAFKRKINGIVHDESSSGKTSFIEPAEAVELNNELRELEFAERREIIRILIEFTDFIRPYSEELFKAYAFMGQIDFIRAKALYALQIEAILPAIFDQPCFRWIKARHPLLFLNLIKEGRSIVPLDIYLNHQDRILVISGPNAGGKSVCLKTTGLIQYMFQCGMLVPMSENSEMGMFNQLFIDIGDEQSIENDLSTYSSHLLNMKYFLKHADNHTLLLIDEFGTGTEPMLGGAIAESILNKLNQNGVFGVITTHYTNLKHFAASTNGIVNGAMLYDTQHMQPFFQLEIGKPGSSFAFEIARKIGLPDEVLKDATDKIGQEHVDYEKNLRNISRDKRYWEGKREHIRQMEKKIEQLVFRHEQDLLLTQSERKAIIEKARNEAKDILAGTNKMIESTIRQIKENQAEKDKTKSIRKELDIFRENIEKAPLSDEGYILRKIEKLKLREKKGNDKTITEKADSLSVKPNKQELSVGDKVRLVGQDSVGEVLDASGKNIMVAFGQMITSLPELRLEKISNNEFKRLNQNKGSVQNSNYNTHEKKLNFKSQLDVRGMRTDEAIQKVQEYVDEAVMLNIEEVRILHGKGNGILRQMIREFLQSTGLIKSIRDEQIELGGSGISVVHLG